MKRPDQNARPGRTTISDVAAAAGVSRALVSIVMRGVPGASDDTRRRVREVADRLGYRPDQRARLLRQRHSRLLGVSFELGQDFHADLLEQLYIAAAADRWELILSAVTPGRDESSAARDLIAERCEGVFLLSSALSDEDLTLLGHTVPMVTVGRATSAIDAISTDDRGGMRLAIDLLVSLGHTRIAHIDGGDAPSAAERRSGYLAALAEHGIAAHTRILAGGATQADGAVAAQRLASDLPTAIVAFNDRAALGAMAALQRVGLVAPADVSIVGFDDSRAASLPHIDLTTVRQDPAAMAAAAITQMSARVMAREVDSVPGPPTATVLPAELIVRGSTARARR